MLSAKLSVGVPIPVPDIEVNPETNFASQIDLSNKANIQSSVINGMSDGEKASNCTRTE